MYRASRKPAAVTTKLTEAAEAFFRFSVVSFMPQRDKTVYPALVSISSTALRVSFAQSSVLQPNRLTVLGTVSCFVRSSLPIASSV